MCAQFHGDGSGNPGLSEILGSRTTVGVEPSLLSLLCDLEVQRWKGAGGQP